MKYVSSDILDTARSQPGTDLDVIILTKPEKIVTIWRWVSDAGNLTISSFCGSWREAVYMWHMDDLLCHGVVRIHWLDYGSEDSICGTRWPSCWSSFWRALERPSGPYVNIPEHQLKDKMWTLLRKVCRWFLQKSVLSPLSAYLGNCDSASVQTESLSIGFSVAKWVW